MIENPPLAAEYDLVIIGSGGGSIIAALAAKALGKSAVILEKLDRVGGSTSYSGGVWWVPNNPLLAEAGIADSYDQAKRYFDSVVSYRGPGVTPARRDAFLKGAPRMVDFLRRAGMKFRRPRDDWPDYYDEHPGGLPQGRSLMAEPFDLHRLGPWEERLAVYPPMVELPLGADEFPTLFLMKRTMAGKRKAARLAWLMLRDKLLRRKTVANGAAIQGRMLQIALREGIEIHREIPLRRFIVEDGRVVGVVVARDGGEITVRARGGVIVNAGGYSRNAKFRQAHTQGPSGAEWTNANPGDTGEAIEAMMALGAATDCLDTAWWVVTSRNVNGDWPEGAVAKDGTIRPFMHHLDMSLPHAILVDQDGRRFAD
ncbi:MAG: FAD-dependent oxidoreductase, partial [Sphingomicrobium sp.]